MIRFNVTTDPNPLVLRLNEPALNKYALDMSRNTRKESIRLIESGPKTGRKWRNLPNQSSHEKGEAPAHQSGGLVGSHTEPKLTGRFRAEFGEAISYAAYLEFGSSGGLIKERPHLRPALARAAPATPMPSNLIVGG